MGTTSNLSLPYPDSADTPNGAAQIQALADDLDDLLTSESWTLNPAAFDGTVVLTRVLNLVVASFQLTHPSPPWTSSANYQINSGELVPTQFRPVRSQVQQVIAVNYNTTGANGIATVVSDGRILIGPADLSVTVIRGTMSWETT